jgi:hypothetical protein
VKEITLSANDGRAERQADPLLAGAVPLARAVALRGERASLQAEQQNCAGGKGAQDTQDTRRWQWQVHRFTPVVAD